MIEDQGYRAFGIWRFFLALCVMFQHFGVNLGSSALRKIASFWLPGSIAVPVFFTLSGFIVFEAGRTYYLGSPLRFAANRATRLLPLFAIAVVASALVLSLTGHDFSSPIPDGTLKPANLTANLLYLLPYQNLVLSYDLLPVFWAVRWELVFYVFIALTLLLSSSGATYAITFLTLSTFIGMKHGAGDLRFIAAIGANFCIGSLTALAVRERNAFCAGLALATFVVLVSECEPTLPHSWRLVAVFSAGQLISFALLFWRPSLWHQQRDAKLGDLSYPLYILHLPVGYAVLGVVGSGVVGFTIATLLSLALAWIANSAIEKPMRKVRSLIRGRTISPVSSQAMIIQSPIQAKAISINANS